VDPQQTSEETEGMFALDVEPSVDVEDLEGEVTAPREEEEVREYIEPLEEAKVYITNLPSPCTNALSGVSVYLSHRFWEIIGVKLDLAPKIEFVPHELFYKCENLKKNYGGHKVFDLRVQTELINSVSRLGKFSRF
jgi:hypothetical protein